MEMYKYIFKNMKIWKYENIKMYKRNVHLFHAVFQMSSIFFDFENHFKKTFSEKIFFNFINI